MPKGNSSHDPIVQNNELSLSNNRANYVLAVLFVVYVVNFIDRQILAILLEPIKNDLQVSDTAMGFLTGFAFAIFYTFTGIPIARWADRGSRTTIIAIGLFLWSTMTGLSGLARNFFQLALARIGVGVGEACASPASHSLISDYFPPEHRATALSIYNMGACVGLLFGIFIGGWIAEYYGWRVAFFVVGFPGIALAAVVKYSVAELPRGHSEGLNNAEQYTTGEVFRYMWRLRSFRHLTFASSLYTFATYGLITWVPAFLMRTHEMSISQVATWYGPILGVGSATGTFIGGVVCDSLIKKDIRWQSWICALGGIVMVPFLLLFLFLPNYVLALSCYIPALVFGAFFIGPTFAMAQGLAKLSMRAVASSVVIFFNNLIGMGLGAQVVGILNDILAESYGSNAIRYSLLIVGATTLWAAGHSMLAAHYIRDDLNNKDN